MKKGSVIRYLVVVCMHSDVFQCKLHVEECEWTSWYIVGTLIENHRSAHVFGVDSRVLWLA